MDECATANGGCSQTCHNTLGSFLCECDSGYELAANGLTCQGKLQTTSPRGDSSLFLGNHACGNLKTQNLYVCYVPLGKTKSHQWIPKGDICTEALQPKLQSEITWKRTQRRQEGNAVSLLVCSQLQGERTQTGCQFSTVCGSHTRTRSDVTLLNTN